MENCVGIIKEIDKLGRIVIPKEMRDRLGWGRNVEVLLTEEGVLLRDPKYRLVRVDMDTPEEKENKNQP